MYSKETINKGNLLIDDLMGDNKYPHRAIEDFEYHTSWDWQIPAYSKIYDMCWKLINKGLMRAGDTNVCSHDYYRAISENNPLKAFETIINLITIYNQAKTALNSK